MATPKQTPIAWTRCRGRNGYDAPLDVPDDMGTEVLNMTFDEGGLGTKRGGSEAVTLSGDSHTGYNALFRFVPGQNEALGEVFIVSADATPKIVRIPPGSTKDELTLKDNIAATAAEVSAAVINGKLYLAYDSTVNRLHVYDPGLSTTEVRRSGLATPAAPTAADTGAGSYAATIRYYKVAYTEQRSSVTVRRSELSPVLSFTPSGSGTHARVTKPAAISEGETHWELYGAEATDGPYYIIATTAVGTTTYDDNADPADYDENDAAATAGTNTPFPSVKYLATDGSVLGGYGVWETSAGDSITPKAGTFYFTDPLDTTDIHDDERISNTTSVINRITVGRNNNAEDRGLAFFDNAWWAFQSKGIVQFIPTGNTDVPFRRVKRSSQLGLLRHQSIVEAEDEFGRPALYFLDPVKGPYRYGAAGFQWCGKDVMDLWRTIKLSATVTAFGVSYPDRSLILWWIATGSSATPNMVIVYDVTEGKSVVIGPDGSPTDVRYGWMKWTGTFASATCGALLPSSLDPTVPRTLVPYAGASSGTTLLRYSESATADNAVNFQAYAQSKAWDQEPLFADKALLKSYLVADTSTGVTITQTLIRNFTDETSRTSSAVLTAAGSETSVMKKFEDAALVDAWTFQVRLGDSAAAANAWTLHRWYATVETRGDR